MKSNLITKLAIIILFIVTSVFLFPSKIESVYQRYGGVIYPNTSSWDSTYIKMPAVIYDKSLYKMLYSAYSNGRWQIGLAYSLDGINWIKFITPIKSRLIDLNRDAHDPTWFYNNETSQYEMWYASSINGGQNDFKIYHSISDDGINWNNSTDELVYTPTQTWESTGISCPFVIKIGSLYYMWYAGRNSSWQIGLATSTDGINWSPYVNNPVLRSDSSYEYGQVISPEVIYEKIEGQDNFHMWYTSNNIVNTFSIAYAHSNDGIAWIKPSNNPILLKSGIVGAFDKNGVSEPSVYKNNQNILLWYGGVYLSSTGIGLAYYGDAPVAQPTPSGSLFPTIAPTNTPIPTETPTPMPTATPVPTATPTPTPTPTPKPKEPIVIIPGMFASWNKEAIFEGKTSYSSPWKLLPFVKEYDGIILTLKNLGYTENDLLYVWPYDWRKNVSENTTKLNSFLNTNVFSKYPHAKISLVGHSLGGLIARSWAQTNDNTEKLSHLVTVGSPNLGVIQPYRAWEGGDISQDSSAMTVASHLLLHIRKNKLQTDREAIQQLFPVLKDLLPTAPYLIRKTDNTEIAKSQMYVWNSWLETLNTSISPLYPLFDAIGGTGNNTPHTYVVAQPTKIDFLLGNWQDGKPVETKTETGDGTVTTARSIFSDDENTILSQDHGTLIASKEGIKEILGILDISYTEDQITEASSTKFTPSLLFTMQSPATISVATKETTYTDTDGILFIPNAVDGQYTVTITGTGSGSYHLSIGQFGNTNTVWTDITNTTNLGKVDTYSVQFSATSPSETPISSFSVFDWLSQLDKELLSLEQFDRQDVRKMRLDLSIAKRALERNASFITKIQLEKIFTLLSRFRKNKKDPALQLSFVPQETIKRIYVLLFSNKPAYFSTKYAQASMSRLEKEQERVLTYIERKKPHSAQILFYQMGENSLQIGKTSLANNQIAKASIYFLDAQLLFNEALR